MNLVVTMPDAGNFPGGAVAWEVLNAACAIQNEALESVDLSRCVHLKPYSIALLVAYAHMSQDRPDLILPEDNDCAEHLARLGLCIYFDLEDAPDINLRDTNVPVRCLNDRPGSFSSDAMAVWEEQADGFPPRDHSRTHHSFG